MERATARRILLLGALAAPLPAAAQESTCVFDEGEPAGDDAAAVGSWVRRRNAFLAECEDRLQAEEEQQQQAERARLERAAADRRREARARQALVGARFAVDPETEHLAGRPPTALQEGRSARARADVETEGPGRARFQIRAGIGAAMVSQTLDSATGAVRLGSAPYASLFGTLRLTPFARASRALQGLGLEGNYERAFGAVVSIDDRTMTAASDHGAVAVLYDLSLTRAFGLELRAGYDLMRFLVPAGEALPGIAYNSIDLGGEISLAIFGDALRVRVGGSMLYLVDVGEATQRFGRASARGYALEGSLEGSGRGGLGYFLSIREAAYALNFDRSALAAAQVSASCGASLAL